MFYRQMRFNFPKLFWEEGGFSRHEIKVGKPTKISKCKMGLCPQFLS